MNIKIMEIERKTELQHKMLSMTWDDQSREVELCNHRMQSKALLKNTIDGISRYDNQ